MERGQSYRITDEQQHEKVNDACHLGGDGFPWHQIVNMFSVRKHTIAMLVCLLKPAREDTLSDSALLRDKDFCVSCTSKDIGTHVRDANKHTTQAKFVNNHMTDPYSFH